MRDIKPLLILLLAIGLVSTWVYHIYDKSQYTSLVANVSDDDKNEAQDSLKAIYSSLVTQMGDSLSSVQTTAEDRLKEINVLKNEIRALLKL